MGTKLKNEVVQIGTSDTTAYTVPSGREASITNPTLTNTGADAVVSIHVVASGDSPASSNLLVVDQAVPSNSEVTVNELISMNLSSGDYISAIANVDAVVNFRVPVVEIF